MTLSEQQQLFAKNVGELLTFMYGQTNYRCTFGETYRTQEQAEWYAKQGKGVINSLHTSRLAIDLNLFNCSDPDLCIYTENYLAYRLFGDYWEGLDKNNRWGGYFVSKYGGKVVDPNHFERKPE